MDHPRRVMRNGAWIVLALAPAATAAQIDNFDSGTDSDWARYDPLAGAGGTPATYDFPNGGYRIAADGSPNPAAVGPARAGSLREDATDASFSVAIDLIALESFPLDEAAGLLARVSRPGLGTTNGYAFTYGTGGRDIDLNRITGEQTSLLARTQITLDPTTLGPSQRYRLVFTGTGSLLTGAVYLVDASDESSLGQPLASLSATDGAYASGFNGLITFDNTDTSSGTNGTDATFDNYAADVPEPYGLAVLSVLALYAANELAFGRGVRGAGRAI